jgi:hypothetical protein
MNPGRFKALLGFGVVLGLAGGQGRGFSGRDPLVAPFVLLGEDLSTAFGEGLQQLPVMQPIDLRRPTALIHRPPAHI